MSLIDWKMKEQAMLKYLKETAPVDFKRLKEEGYSALFTSSKKQPKQESQE